MTKNFLWGILHLTSFLAGRPPLQPSPPPHTHSPTTQNSSWKLKLRQRVKTWFRDCFDSKYVRYLQVWWSYYVYVTSLPPPLPICGNWRVKGFFVFLLEKMNGVPTVFVYLQIVILYSLVSYNFCKLCMYRICRQLKNLNMFDSNPLFYILLFDMTRNDGLILCGRGDVSFTMEGLFISGVDSVDTNLYPWCRHLCCQR
jgi:hypothetical protein